MRILIAEDEKSLNRIIAKQLKASGYSVDCCFNGEEAYDHASVKAADVKFLKAELDRDDMIVHYDVEFVVGDFEYKYEINAKSGKVIASDKEYND